jgi:hypothetical protein
VADDIQREVQYHRLPYGPAQPMSGAEKLRWKHLGGDRYDTAENRARAYRQAIDTGRKFIYVYKLPKLELTMLMDKPDQDFLRGATVWEQVYSYLGNLYRRVPADFPRAKAVPVVDAFFNVVGHIGWFTDYELLVPAGINKQYPPRQGRLKEIVGSGIPVIVPITTKLSSNQWWEPFQPLQEAYLLMTGIDGSVIAVLGNRDRDGVEPYTIGDALKHGARLLLTATEIALDVLLIYDVALVLTELAVGRLLVWALAREGRSAALGATRELALEAIERKAVSEISTSEAASLLSRTPPVASGSRVLVVGPETEAEFEYARGVTSRGGRATAVNPVKTPAADRYIARGGEFVQGRVETLPQESVYDIIREDYPYPTGKFINPKMVDARLSRLKPGGSWVVVTESTEFANALEAAGEHFFGKGKVMRREIAAMHEAAPVSPHPKDPRRFALIFRR